jgi:hypothetical protein
MGRHQKVKILKALVPVAAAAGILFSAAAASASVPHGLVFNDPHSLTHVVADPDSGGNGNWALDNFWRSASVKGGAIAPLSDCAAGATACYSYTARISDRGTFVTIPGAFTPNQGGTGAGSHIHGIVRGSMSGYGYFGTFYADSKPAAALYPHAFNAGVTPFIVGSPSSSTFPERFFPAGTTFEGLNEGVWGYGYTARVTHWAPVLRWVTFWRYGHPHHVLVTVWERHTVTQHWTDAYNNLGGQSATAGNITG